MQPERWLREQAAAGRAAYACRMTERRRAQDPAEGADDPEVYGNGGQSDANPDPETESALEDITDAMPGSGRLNQDENDPDASDPDLRPNTGAPLP